MEKPIWICVGSTGEYSDHIEWFVRAFTDEAKAQDFVGRVSAEYRKIREALGDAYYYGGGDQPKNPLDPNMQGDYTGTNYSLECVTLED